MSWDEVDKTMNSNNNDYKTYAPNGEYDVHLKKATVVDKIGWKSPAVSFEWEDDDQYKYPHSVYHWLSMENANYRKGHQRAILMALGIEKEQAQQLIDSAVEKEQESRPDRAKLVKGYQALWDRVVQRYPKARIVLQDQYDGEKPRRVVSAKGTSYTPNESDFAQRGVRVMAERKADPLAGSTEISMDEIPFD